MRRQLTSLFLGTALIFVGLIMFLEKLDIVFFTWFEIYPVFFLLIGAFSFLSVNNERKSVAFWGTCFTVLGVFFLLRNYGFLEILWLIPLYSVFTIAPGLGLVVLFFIKPNDWGLLVPGGLLLLIGAIGIAQAVGIDPNSVLAYWPVLLILLGLGIILRSLGVMGKETSE